MNGYLYCAQCGDHPIFKIGHTVDPQTRLAALQTLAPFPMHYLVVLDAGCKFRAAAFEGFAKRSLQGCNTHGEWFNDIDAILDMFEVFAPSVDVTDQFPRPEVKPLPRTPYVGVDHLEYQIKKAAQRRKQKLEFYANNPEYNRHFSAEEIAHERASTDIQGGAA